MVTLTTLNGGQISPWPTKADNPEPQPQQFMIRRLVVDLSGGDINLSYDWRTKPDKNPDPQACIDAGLKVLLDGPPPNPINDDEDKDHPLDLPVRLPTVVFLEIAAAKASQFQVSFSEKFAALSIGGNQDDPNGLYGGLHYVDGSGRLSTRPVPGCTRIMFLAHPGAAPASRPINYHVCFTNSGGVKFELIIDPEVKNPGVGGVPV
jgi:hypothetical protein